MRVSSPPELIMKHHAQISHVACHVTRRAEEPMQNAYNVNALSNETFDP